MKTENSILLLCLILMVVAIVCMFYFNVLFGITLLICAPLVSIIVEGYRGGWFTKEEGEDEVSV